MHIFCFHVIATAACCFIRLTEHSLFNNVVTIYFIVKYILQTTFSVLKQITVCIIAIFISFSSIIFMTTNETVG